MNNPIVIRKNLKLGELDAEADRDLLSTCFIDKGELDQLIDVNNPSAIILGRTGSGKSALLFGIEERVEHSSMLDPNDISIRFLEHSNIIQFLNELNIKLDLFYRILWRHILLVELLKLRYNLRSESDNKGLLNRMYQFVERDRIKRKALDYFSEWGDKFWLETDEQLRELTSKFSRDIKSNLGAKYSEVDISLEGARSLSEEQRTEITNRASQVVSGIQIKRLNEVFDLLAEYAFQDRQKKYYILIDKLDEDWAETETRCRFIRALIEETKAFRHLEQVKIISALRRDLLDLVFDKTRDAGFQEEKYEAYFLKIRWSKLDLQSLLEKRTNEVFKRQYTNQGIVFGDVFPSPRKGDSETSFDYIIERTLFRPRDALQFANECFYIAADRDRISWRAIHAAESGYSSKRLKSLREEWHEYYPALEESIEILRGIHSPFTRSILSSDRTQYIVDNLYDYESKDPCVLTAKKLFNGSGQTKINDVTASILRCLYHVGAIGIKISSLDSFIWSFVDQPTISKSEAKRANQIVVHKMLHQTLEIKLN